MIRPLRPSLGDVRTLLAVAVAVHLVFSFVFVSELLWYLLSLTLVISSTSTLGSQTTVSTVEDDHTT